MIFDFLFKKKIPVPVEAGDFMELQLSAGGGERTLYAKVSKVSKKRNIFVNFLSRDKGDDLTVGTKGSAAALKQNMLISFPTQLLHRDGETFIFSPPSEVVNRRIPPNSENLTYHIQLPIEYRPLSNLDLEKGTLVEFSPASLGFLADQPVPLSTLLAIVLSPPWKESSSRLKGTVTFCQRYRKDAKKHLVRISTDDLDERDKTELLWFSLVSTWKGAPV